MIAMIGLAVVSCEVYFASIFLICFALAFKYQTFSSNFFTLFLLIHFFLLLFRGFAFGAGFLVNYNDVAGQYASIFFAIGK